MIERRITNKRWIVTTNPTPNKLQLDNVTYLAKVMEEYHENKPPIPTSICHLSSTDQPCPGPITGVDGCMGAFIPLTSITTNISFLSSLLISHPSNSPLFLGLHVQQTLLYAHYPLQKAAILEIPITGAGQGAPTIFLKPLSRGLINIDLKTIIKVR